MAVPILELVRIGMLVTACWAAPVDAPVSDPFRPPACVWCPGNRGIEYATGAGESVRAVASGVVTYAGTVAGVGYVVVQHADGLRATYGNVSTGRFESGARVVRGMVVGSTAGPLHFGLRRGAEYVDPSRFIGEVVFRARLVPLDGTGRRPVGPPVLRCSQNATG